MRLSSQTVLLAAALGFLATDAAAQSWQAEPNRRADRGRGSYERSGPDSRRSLRPGNGYGGVQLDVTALMEAQPQQSEPALRPSSPMFSRGWTRDGFGGQPTGWR